eukprot:1152685-Pelagomonas_calceolata.AAC.3
MHTHTPLPSTWSQGSPTAVSVPALLDTINVQTLKNLMQALSRHPHGLNIENLKRAVSHHPDGLNIKNLKQALSHHPHGLKGVGLQSVAAGIL